MVFVVHIFYNFHAEISGMTDNTPAPGINGAANTGIMEMMGLRKSPKLARQDFPALYGNRHKKVKVSPTAPRLF